MVLVCPLTYDDQPSQNRWDHSTRWNRGSMRPRNLEFVEDRAC